MGQVSLMSGVWCMRSGSLTRLPTSLVRALAPSLSGSQARSLQLGRHLPARHQCIERKTTWACGCELNLLFELNHWVELKQLRQENHLARLSSQCTLSWVHTQMHSCVYTCECMVCMWVWILLPYWVWIILHNECVCV